MGKHTAAAALDVPLDCMLHAIKGNGGCDAFDTDVADVLVAVEAEGGAHHLVDQEAVTRHGALQLVAH